MSKYLLFSLEMSPYLGETLYSGSEKISLLSMLVSFLGYLPKRATLTPKCRSRTSVECRQQAKAFRNFIHETYTTVRREPSHKVYPVMLNVTDGLCSEMPFGASMVNKENSYAGINALHGLLKANIVGEDIAIVTLYPGQADIYRDALKKCHRYAPAKGYNTVKVGKLEDCVGTDYGIVIVDLVRTANSSGNLGFLSQARRLQLLLTIHRNGLIVVGDRQCTVTSHSRSSTTKLEKVLRWFSDNGRVVGVANGLPTSDPQSTPASSLPPTPTESLPARTYVGLPELWHLEIQEAANKKDRILRAGPTPPQDIEAVRASFARQGFFKTEQDNTMAKGADRKATVIDKSKDLPRDQAPYNANVTRMEASSNSRQSSMAKRISPSTTGGFSPEKSQSRTNFESSARSSGKSKATDDAFSRFQARLKRQGNFPPGPMMNVTEHTRKKNDLAVRSPSPASLSTSTGALAPNPLAKPQAVKAELSVRNLNIGESRIQAEAPIQKAFGKPQSIITEVSGRDDFNTQYRSKYKGIRSIFDTLHRSTEASPNENQLFRRLGEAYIMEDIDEFETVYTELLHLASGIAVSG